MSTVNTPEILDLPAEILRLIIANLYEPWDLNICLDYWTEPPRLLTTISPPRPHLTVCKIIQELAKEHELLSFSGTLRIREGISEFGGVCETFVRHMEDSKHFSWLQENIKLIKFSNPSLPPAVWRFAPVKYSSYFPNTRRIELDCRWASLYANHNVRNLADFFSGADGKLEKQLDYRKAFFLSCERFLVQTIRQGIAITVVREMGVREMTDRCQAVLLSINYVNDGNDKLVLDWKSLQYKSAPIIGWPQNIRPTLNSLEL